MPALSDYVTGTITLTNGSVNFTGTGTGWLAAQFGEGDTIIDLTGATEFMGVIATIDANGAGTLTKVWEGPTLTNVAYRMRYQADGQRVTAQARNLIELLGNGNLQAIAALEGVNEKLIMFNGPASVVLINKSDLVSGADYDVQVADIATRDSLYDAHTAPWRVLVNDMGDGRAAITSKNSDTPGDWSDPAYVTGPVGPMPTLGDVNVTSLDPGDPATGEFVENPPASGTFDLELSIPRGRGYNFLGAYSGATAYILDDTVLYDGATWRALGPTTGNAPPLLPTTSDANWELVAGARGYNPRGGYSGATAYEIDDTVLDNGSTWRAKINTTGNAPPILPATSNTWWELVAAKGTDGTGTGDVVGPVGVTDERIAVFDGTTGKLIKQSTQTVGDLTTSINSKASVGLAIAVALVLGG